MHGVDPVRQDMKDRGDLDLRFEHAKATFDIGEMLYSFAAAGLV